MVERVARAMEPSAFATYDRGYRQTNGHEITAFLNAEKTVKSACRKARAAIEAMRGPMLSVVEDRRKLYLDKAATRDPFAEDCANLRELSEHAADAMTWTAADLNAMIDAALQDNTGGRGD